MKYEYRTIGIAALNDLHHCNRPIPFSAKHFVLDFSQRYEKLTLLDCKSLLKYPFYCRTACKRVRAVP